MCQIDVRSDAIPDAISTSKSISMNIFEIISVSITASNSKAVPKEIFEIISDSITASNSKAVPKAISESISESNSNYSYCSTLVQESALWQRLCNAVGEHLSGWYVDQVNF